MTAPDEAADLSPATVQWFATALMRGEANAGEMSRAADLLLALAAALREARERGEAALEEGEKQRRALIDHADALAEERTRDLIADLAALRTRLARFEALAKEAAANVADYIPLANSGDFVKILRHGREARDILDRLAALHQEDRTDG